MPTDTTKRRCFDLMYGNTPTDTPKRHFFDLHVGADAYTPRRPFLDERYPLKQTHLVGRRLCTEGVQVSHASEVFGHAKAALEMYMMQLGGSLNGQTF
ncbi:hypothetical protein O181_078695 [Austropuccinia psidii MF-1]|uniref:Uncharacterized protein n=1 Tax=Austropuccinia psidii MF-1 TaxID=1389203 RepID=A0A9Q3FDB3_9BASI|nr:hypothetical protein [Austropuccinia psidii MF-1]